MSSSLPSSSWPSTEALLDQLTQARANKLKAQAEEDRCLDALAQLVEEGQLSLEQPLSWNDWTITQKSRKSYTYPPHILEQRQQLKASERLSVALGEATLTVTTFVELRQPRP